MHVVMLLFGHALGSQADRAAADGVTRVAEVGFRHRSQRVSCSSGGESEAANENPDEIVSRCGATAPVAICIPRMVVVAEQMAANGSISNKYITHRHEQSVQNPVQP